MFTKLLLLSFAVLLLLSCSDAHRRGRQRNNQDNNNSNNGTCYSYTQCHPQADYCSSSDNCNCYYDESSQSSCVNYTVCYTVSCNSSSSSGNQENNSYYNNWGGACVVNTTQSEWQGHSSHEGHNHNHGDENGWRRGSSENSTDNSGSSGNCTSYTVCYDINRCPGDNNNNSSSNDNNSWWRRMRGRRNQGSSSTSSQSTQCYNYTVCSQGNSTTGNNTGGGNSTTGGEGGGSGIGGGQSGINGTSCQVVSVCFPNSTNCIANNNTSCFQDSNGNWCANYSVCLDSFTSSCLNNNNSNIVFSNVTLCPGQNNTGSSGNSSTGNNTYCVLYNACFANVSDCSNISISSSNSSSTCYGWTICYNNVTSSNSSTNTTAPSAPCPNYLVCYDNGVNCTAGTNSACFNNSLNVACVNFSVCLQNVSGCGDSVNSILSYTLNSSITTVFSSDNTSFCNFYSTCYQDIVCSSNSNSTSNSSSSSNNSYCIDYSICFLNNVNGTNGTTIGGGNGTTNGTIGGGSGIGNSNLTIPPLTLNAPIVSLACYPNSSSCVNMDNNLSSCFQDNSTGAWCIYYNLSLSSCHSNVSVNPLNLTVTYLNNVTASNGSFCVQYQICPTQCDSLFSASNGSSSSCVGYEICYLASLFNNSTNTTMDALQNEQILDCFYYADCFNNSMDCISNVSGICQNTSNGFCTVVPLCLSHSDACAVAPSSNSSTNSTNNSYLYSWSYNTSQCYNNSKNNLFCQDFNLCVDTNVSCPIVLGAFGLTINNQTSNPCVAWSVCWSTMDECQGQVNNNNVTTGNSTGGMGGNSGIGGGNSTSNNSSLIVLPVSPLFQVSNSSLSSSPLFLTFQVVNNQTIAEVIPTVSDLTNVNNLNSSLPDFWKVLNSTSQNVIFLAPVDNAWNNLNSSNSTGLFPSLNCTLFYMTSTQFPLFAVNLNNITSSNLTNLNVTSSNSTTLTVETFVPTLLSDYNWIVTNYSLVPSLNLSFLPLDAFRSIVLINGVPLPSANSSNFLASNGELVLFDFFLLPPVGNISASLSRLQNLTIWNELIGKASSDVLNILNSDHVTFFAPTDVAVQNLLRSLNVSVSNISTLNQTQIDGLLLNHIIQLPFCIYSSAIQASNITLNSSLANSTIWTSLNSTSNLPQIVLGVTNSAVSAVSGSFNALVTFADITATNGVIHVIDNVLVPQAIFPNLVSNNSTSSS